MKGIRSLVHVRLRDGDTVAPEPGPRGRTTLLPVVQRCRSRSRERRVSGRSCDGVQQHLEPQWRPDTPPAITPSRSELLSGPRGSSSKWPLRPRPDLADGETWLQVVNEHSTAYDVAYCFTEAFEEDHLVAALGKVRFSVRFQNAFPGVTLSTPRKQLDGVKHLQMGTSHTRQQWGVMLESSRRRALETVRLSWPSTRSALFAWGIFCDSFVFSHFPATAERVKLYASFFSNGGTLQKYVQHLRWAHSFVGLANAW